MDIFNKKRVAELEKELKKARKELSDARTDATNYRKELETWKELVKFEETIPEECVKGPWCKACEFVKEFECYQFDFYGHRYIEPLYSCGKGESCKNFVQKEMVKE